MADQHVLDAAGRMKAFVDRTGVTSDRPQQRYLWTDAFAVCNLLGLARVTGDTGCTELALRVVDVVHEVLGKHRPDDPRRGWLSGLDEEEGRAHPTRAGLRIGKALPERAADAPLDPRLEWERDGQYFHYLTRWMHALDQVARATGAPKFNVWARELAEAAARAFVVPPAGAKPRMVWKMSVDLARPLVPSMGHHDPLDGFVTCAQLRATAEELGCSAIGPDLTRAMSTFGAMVSGRDWATDDPLGIGGLLTDVCRVHQLVERNAFPSPELLHQLVTDVRAGLQSLDREALAREPAAWRLPFRELGFALGVRGVEMLAPSADGEVSALLRDALPLASAIERFWVDPAHQRAETWSDHLDINEVMLATTLVPGGYTVLGRPHDA